MLFQTLTEKISTPSFILNVKNLELSATHWQSLKYIERLTEELELLYIQFGKEPKLFSSNLVKLFLNLIQENRRIQKIQFYRENKQLRVLTISAIPNFKPENYLQRLIGIFFKKLNFGIDILDISEDEWKEISGGQRKLPKDWELDEPLTNSFARYQEIFI